MWKTVRLLPESDFESIQKGICPECDGKLEIVGIYYVDGSDEPPMSCYRCNKCYWIKWHKT